MKKTTKILLLVLSFVLVFSLSAVAAFAAEAAEEKDWGDVKVLKKIDFESVADDFYHNGDERFDSAIVEDAQIVFANWNNYGNRTGIVRSLVSYDGNTAVSYEYTSKSSRLNPYLFIKLGDNPTKAGSNSMSKNAYYVIDWDMYSPNGNYGTSGHLIKYIFTRLDSAGAAKNDKAIQLSDIRTDKNGNTVINGVTLASSNQWQHYTTIIEVTKSYDAAGNLIYDANAYLFVDGAIVQTVKGVSPALTASDFYVEEGEFKTSLINLVEIRIEFKQNGKTGTESVAFDNFVARSFTKYYGGVDEIASVVKGEKKITDWGDSIFKKNYGYPFGQLAATVTAPDGTTSYYDSAKKAMDNAVAGSVVDLYADAFDVNVNSAITVNSNGYDFKFSSSKYSASVTENKVGDEIHNSYKFSRSQNSELAVYWDLGDENDLFAITTSILGTVPSYPKDLSDCIVYGYAEDDVEKKNPISAKRLVGWSYDKENAKAGKTDEIRIVNVFDIESVNGAWIALYPVFEDMPARVIDPEGNVSFYGDFGAAVSSSAPGSTVQLCADISVTSAFSISSNKTIDLNGHTVILNSNDVVNKLNSGGTVSSWGTKPNLFTVAEGVSFTLTSSTPGAKVFVSAYVTVKKADGSVDKTQISGNSAIYVTGSGKKEVDITINGENLSMYCSTIVADWANELKGNVTINGGKYYRTVADLQGLFGQRSTNSVSYVVNDAFLYSDKGPIFSNNESASKVNQAYSFTFNNCIFYAPGSDTILNLDTDCTLYINNSVIYAKVANKAGKIYLGEGTVYNSADVKVEGNVIVDSSCEALPKPTETTFSYAKNTFMKDDANHIMSLDSYIISEPIEVKATFDTWLAGPNNSLLIEWLAPDGVTVLASGVGLPGYTATPPAVDLSVKWENGDGWRDLKVTNWENPQGEINKFDVPGGVTGKYTFKAVLPNPADPDVEYVASPTKILWNISLGSNVGINFYIPVEDGVAINSVKVGSTTLAISANNVTFGGIEYYQATYQVASLDVHLKHSAVVNFTIDGVQYSGELAPVSALEYVQGMIESEEISDYQKTSLADMMRYISELCKRDSGKVPEEYAQFVEKYKNILTPYDYESEDRYELSEDMKPYIDMVDVGVIDGEPAILIYWSEEALAAYENDSNLTITLVNNSNSGLASSNSGKIVDDSYSVILIKDSSYLGDSFKIRIRGRKTLELIGAKTAESEYSFVSMILDLQDAGIDSGFAESLYALEKNKNNPPQGETDAVFPAISVISKKDENEE